MLITNRAPFYLSISRGCVREKEQKSEGTLALIESLGIGIYYVSLIVQRNGALTVLIELHALIFRSYGLGIIHLHLLLRTATFYIQYHLRSKMKENASRKVFGVSSVCGSFSFSRCLHAVLLCMWVQVCNHMYLPKRTICSCCLLVFSVSAVLWFPKCLNYACLFSCFTNEANQLAFLLSHRIIHSILRNF